MPGKNVGLAVPEYVPKLVEMASARDESSMLVWAAASPSRVAPTTLLNLHQQFTC